MDAAILVSRAMAFTGRYTTEFTLLSVAVVGLFVLSVELLSERKTSAKILIVLTTISIAALSLSSWKLGLEVAARTKVERNQALTVLPYLLYMNPALDGLPGTPVLCSLSGSGIEVLSHVENLSGVRIRETNIRSGV